MNDIVLKKEEIEEKIEILKKDIQTKQQTISTLQNQQMDISKQIYINSGKIDLYESFLKRILPEQSNA